MPTAPHRTPLPSALLLVLVLAAVPRAPAALPAWPSPEAPLAVVPVVVAARVKPIRLYLDAGHGAPGNLGNRSVTCEHEGDAMLRVAIDLAARLERTGLFRVKLSRTGDETPTYQARLAAAAAFGAEAIVSLHSDARGGAYVWQPGPGLACLRNDECPGFGILMSDEGPARLVARRRTLARALARRLGETGLTTYDGADWLALYEADEAPGVFIDRRPRRQRVYFLRKPRIPSVIIETHHALDLEETRRWNEARTLEAFASAVAAGLVDALRPAAKGRRVHAPPVP